MPESGSFFNRAVAPVNRLREPTHHAPADPRADRVPPGQQLNSGFPALYHEIVFRVDPCSRDSRPTRCDGQPLTD